MVIARMPDVEPDRFYSSTEISDLKLLPFSEQYIRKMWREGKLIHTRLSERKIGMYGWQILEFIGVPHQGGAVERPADKRRA